MPPCRSPPGDHFLDPEMIGETERSPAQRRKTGAKDHAVIGVLGRGDDLFFETARGFVHHQVNKAQRKIVPRPEILWRIGGSGAILPRPR